MRRAEALAAAWGHFHGRFLDLGSGGGVPGLVLALGWPRARGALVDARRASAAHLEAAVAELGLGERVEVVRGRAEELARDPALRECFDLVVARGFGRPAVTAECAVGFLRPAGRLVVTEPPVPAAERWPREGLARLGLSGPEPAPGFVSFARTGDPVGPWPRRRPSRSPLW